MRDLLLAVFHVSLFVAIPLAAFATGLRVTDALWLWRHPRLLVRSLLAVLVLVPAVGTLLVEALRPHVLTRAGIVVCLLSVGIGPTDTLKRTSAPHARIAYEVGLDILLLLLAVLYIPAAIALHGAIFHHQIQIDPMNVAEVVLVQMLAPLALGIAFARFLPRLTDKLARVARRVVAIALGIVVVFALLATWRSLFSVGADTWLACLVVAGSALLIGHLCGIEHPEIQASLAAFSVLRFPSLAVVIVSALPGGKGQVLMPVILVYVLSSAILLAVYHGLFGRAFAEHV